MGEGDQKGKLQDCALIALAWTIPALLFSPFQDTPFIDDWVYAFSVQRLLNRGELRFLEYCGGLNHAPVLWGALYCLPAGFSFTALRVSTWVLALACLWFLYLLLREIGVARQSTLLGAATLGLNPIFFILSFTFMTDVPFLAFMTGSAYAMTRAVRRKHDGWLLMSSALACLAVGIRVVGLVLPIAAAFVLFLHAGTWGRSARRVLVAVLPVLAFAVLALWRRDHIFYSADMSYVANSSANRLQQLKYAVPLFPRMLPEVLAFAAAHVGLAVMPLTISSLRYRLFVRSCMPFALLGLALAAGRMVGLKYTLPLLYGDTWSFLELGATEPLVPGYQRPAVPWWACWPAAAIGWASCSVLASSLRSRRLGENGRCAYLIWLGVGHLLLMALLWMNYDRYALVLFPIGISLLLAGDVQPRPVATLALLAVFATVCFAGLRDHLRYNAALWSAVNDLHSQGVPASQINGGYIVNGWFQYAHPENAPRDDQENIQVIGVNASGSLDFEIANQVSQGSSILAEIPYQRWWGRSGRIYVLRRDPAKGHGFRRD
jgi:hypothetical protein